MNVQLGSILAGGGLDANAETVIRRALPDVLVNLDGVKLILEGRISTQRAALFRDAEERVLVGLADISMAVLYKPGLLVASSQDDLTKKIRAARYGGRIFYMGRDGPTWTSFNGVPLDEMIQTINTVYWLRVQNDVVREQVRALQATIDSVVAQASATHLFFSSQVLIGRLNQALGIDADANAEENTEGE